jgi:hypothetical protein
VFQALLAEHRRSMSHSATHAPRHQ